jgi:hypothetical protein
MMKMVVASRQRTAFSRMTCRRIPLRLAARKNSVPRPNQRPRLSLLPEDFSLLADEQRKGIDDKRWHDILALC